jgi:hypothetical protein
MVGTVSAPKCVHLHSYILFLGGFVYAKLLGTPIYIMCDPRAVEDILMENGKHSAGRPSNVMVQEV